MTQERKYYTYHTHTTRKKKELIYLCTADAGGGRLKEKTT